MLLVVSAVAVGIFAYFFLSYIEAKRSYENASLVQRANAVIAESREKESRVPERERLRVWLSAHGWSGSVGPVLAGAGIGYIAVTLALLGLGVGSSGAYLLAAAGCVAISRWAFSFVEGRKQERFRRQLLQLLNLMAAQIEAGSGPQRAMEQIVGQIDEPLGSELRATLAEAGVSKDLIGALRDLERRYPSRALVMLIAALEIDQQNGGRLSPVLRQASATLGREFELSEEALAEISQTRAEFYGIVGIVLFIVMLMFTTSGSVGKETYSSGTGLVILLLAGANFGYGVVRVLRLFNKIKGRS